MKFSVTCTIGKLIGAGYFDAALITGCLVGIEAGFLSGGSRWTCCPCRRQLAGNHSPHTDHGHGELTGQFLKGYSHEVKVGKTGLRG
jgi:hypothetical protein